MRWLDGITDSTDMSLRELWELEMDRKPCVLKSMVRNNINSNRLSKQEVVTVGP